MGGWFGKLTFLVHILVNHWDAIEADLFPDVSLPGLYLEDSPVTLRLVSVLVFGRLLIDTGKEIIIRRGTALARSVHGELGDWSRLDLIVANACEVKVPEDKATVAWKAAEHDRIKKLRAARRK